MSRIGWMRRLAQVVILSAALVAPVLAEDKIVIKVGVSADAAQEAKATDLTVDALRAAQKAKDRSAFSVTTTAGAKHALSISAKDAGDILGGSTLVAETDGGGPKVWITFAQAKKDAPAASDSGSGGGGGGW